MKLCILFTLILCLLIAGLACDEYCLPCEGKCCKEEQSCIYKRCCQWEEDEKIYQTHPFYSLDYLWGTSADDIFALANEWDEYGDDFSSRLVHYNGDSWWQMKRIDDVNIVDMWGESSSNAFIVGGGRDPDSGERYSVILHHDGIHPVETFRTKPSEVSSFFSDIWGSSGTDIYAVGWYSMVAEFDIRSYRGCIFHFNGLEWSDVGEDEKMLWSGIWGTSGANVYFVGAELMEDFSRKGLILHFDGTSWNIEKEYPEAELSVIWGSSENDIYAGGNIVVHYDGSDWNEVDIGAETSITRLHGTSSADVFALDLSDNLYHYDGYNWTQLPEPGDWRYSVDDIWISPKGDLWAIAGENQIYRLNCN
jgi:hypothetical protein